MNEDVSHKIYPQGYNLESPLAACLLLTSVIGFWVESIGLIEIAVHNHLISNIIWWTMKKHWKSHLTKNWLNEWAINGNFHFLSHRCKLIKIVKTNFVKGLKTCSKKSWSFGQPFIQPSGYVPYWHQWAPNYWFRHWWNIIGPTILFQLDIPFRPHNRLHICWSDAANGGGRYFSGHITGLFDQQKFKIFSWILLGDTCF